MSVCMAAAEELDEGTRTFNYGPHPEAPPSASVRIISGGAPWPPPLSPSMNQTFHYMLTLLSCAECVYTMGKWWGIGNLMSDGLPALVQKLADSVSQRVRGRPCPPSHANCLAWQTPPSLHSHSLPGPSHLRRQTAGRGEITHGRWSNFTLAWPFQALCPCHMSLTLVFCSDNTSRQGLSVSGETQKRKGEEKLTKPLFAVAQIL